MEFHNVKLLPKGLPEITAQLVPYEIYPDTKVIAFSRKGMKFNGHGGRGELGSVSFDHLTASYCIVLYPTMCCSNGGHGNDYPGTPSFRLWMAMLSTTIHEIGHLATYELYAGIPRDIEHHYENYRYVEKLADEWMECALARILRVDPRLGQPPGALTGYPGILAYELRSNGGKPWDGFNPHRIADWRALSCGGQVTINDIAEKLMLQEHPGYEGWAREKARYRRAIHRATEALGLCRYFTNKNGRRYLMFNAAEAEAVYEWLADNKEAPGGICKRLARKEARMNEKGEFPWSTNEGPRRLWKASVESALREAKSLQAFCKGRFQYSQYEGVLEDLIRALEMEAVTAANM